MAEYYNSSLSSSPHYALSEFKPENITINDDTEDISLNLRLGNYSIIKKRGHSRVWAFFGKVQDNATGNVLNGVIACRECLSIVRSNSLTTSNLLHHKCVKNSTTRENDKVEVSNTDKTFIEKRVARFFVDNSIPFAAIESRSFYDFLEGVMVVGAKYTKPVNMMSLYMDTSVLAREGEVLKQGVLTELHHHLSRIDHLAATIGFWSNDNNKSYFLSVSIFYIENDNLGENFLGLRQIQSLGMTPKVIRETISLIFFEYGITDMEKVTFVTNSESILDEALAGLQQIHCVENVLNKLFTECVNLSESIKDFLKDCRSMIQFLKTTRLSSLIKSDTIGNWRSTHEMLECICQNWRSIEQVANVDTQSINIKALIPFSYFLKKFIESISELRKSNAPSIHEIYPQFEFLIDLCESSDDDNELVCEIKQNLKFKITEQRTNINIEHKVALFLFPLCKSLYNIPEKEKMNIYRWIADHVQTDEKLPPEAYVAAEYSSPKNKSLSKYARFYGPNTSVAENSVLKEINRYIAEPMSLEEIDVLEWWSSRRDTYKYLYQVFRDIMCIPATIMGVEKIQNAVSNSHSNESNLGISELETILVLKYNSKSSLNRMF